jgi:glyoxylase-like metal-dependent hydrolase (beta-lactamase superfamily II)
MGGSEDREYVVTIARYGTRTARRSEVFLNYALYGEPDGPIGMDYFVWIARNAERTVVVDTGFSRAGGDARGRTMLVEPPALFDRLGVDPAATTVVITHAHYDHIGNLGHFPDAPVYAARRELEFWTGPLRDRRLFHHSVDDADLAHLSDLEGSGRLVTFAGEIEVAPGISMTEVGGHTPGQCVVRVPTAAGTVLLASDAVHYQEELDRDMPFSSVANVADMYSALALIRAMRAAGEVDIVVTGHDPATLAQFAPMPGDLGAFAAQIGAA